MKCPIPLRALVVEQESRVTKNGDLFWQVILKTRIGNIKAFMWDAPKDVEQNNSFPHVNDIIEVDGFKDQLEDRKNIVINKFHRILKRDLPPEDKCILEFEKSFRQGDSGCMESDRGCIFLGERGSSQVHDGLHSEDWPRSSREVACRCYCPPSLSRRPFGPYVGGS